MDPLQQQAQIVGLVWYRLEDFEQIKAIMVDRHRLPGTYTLWRLKAEQAERQARRNGQRTVRAYIDPSTFVDWCRARGLNVDANARIQFANTAAIQAHTDLGGGQAAGSA